MSQVRILISNLKKQWRIPYDKLKTVKKNQMKTQKLNFTYLNNSKVVNNILKGVLGIFAVATFASCVEDGEGLEQFEAKPDGEALAQRFEDNRLNAVQEFTMDAAVGISLRASGGGGSTYAFCSVTNNVITTTASPDSTLILGMSISGNTVDVSGNIVTTFGANQHSLRLNLASSYIDIHNNKFRSADGLMTDQILLDGAVALVGCNLGINIYQGHTGDIITTNGSFTCNNSLISAPVNLYMTSDGVGAVNITDPFGVVSSISSTAVGFSVIFNALLKPDSCGIQMGMRSNNIYAIQCDGPSSTSANFGVRDSANAGMPASTNLLKVDLQLNKYLA